jgi:hypothetical protein
MSYLLRTNDYYNICNRPNTLDDLLKSHYFEAGFGFLNVLEPIGTVDSNRRLDFLATPLWESHISKIRMF